MANRTAKEAQVVHGTNPQYLVEKIIRTRIYESRYWKEECFGLSAADVFEKAMDLRFIGGIYGGNIKPSPFLCLVLKMLQIQPDREIIISFMGKYGEKYKYVRAIGAYYWRLTASSLDIWKHLDPLYNDLRKLRIMDKMGRFSVIHMDEFVDMLLREERVFDVILPRISKRRVHEEANELDPRISALEQEIGDVDDDSDSNDGQEEEKKKENDSKLKDKRKKEKKEKVKMRNEASSGKDETEHHRHKEKDRTGDRSHGDKDRDRDRDRDRDGRRRSRDRDSPYDRRKSRRDRSHSPNRRRR